MKNKKEKIKEKEVLKMKNKIERIELNEKEEFVNFLKSFKDEYKIYIEKLDKNEKGE